MPASTTGRPAAVLSILVTANTRTAQANMAMLDRQMAYSVRRANVANVALARSVAGLRFAAVGASAAIAGSVAAAVQYESAFASVRKTVEASEPQFRRLEDRFLGLSEHVPESAAALAELAGEAGALGIEAGPLTKFTKTAAQLGTTTEVSASAAADGLARIANIMDLRVGPSVRRMGDVLVDLGNKGASTEGEILEMSKRIAGSGQVVGMAYHEVMGLAAGLANLGIRAEMGGSAISRVMRGMHVAIREGPSKELSLFAETAGMTTEQFRKSFERDVPATLGHFLDGLARVEKEGGSAQAVLLELGKAAHTSFGEIRVSDTLMRLMSSGRGSGSELARAMKIAHEEFRTGGALAEEASKRYETLASQAEMLRNSAVRMGIEFGESLLPTIKETVSLLRDPDLTIDEKVEGVMGQIGKIIEKAGPTVAKAGAVLGVSLARGVAGAFLEADLLGQLFIGASLIRFVGGPGALKAAGIALAGPIARAFTGHFQAALQYGIARSAVGYQRGFIGQVGFDRRNASIFGGKVASTLAPAIASSLAFATANKIPLAFAAYGVVNVIEDAVSGNFADAGAEIGGGIAGAIAGGLIGGLPGALIGAGIGSELLDSVFGDLFKVVERESPTEQLVKQIREDAEKAKQGINKIGDSVQRSSRQVERARGREREATRSVRRAERALDRARRDYGPNSHEAARAEERLARAKMDSWRASKKLEDLEKLQGAERQLAKLDFRERTGTLAADLADQLSTLKEAREEFASAWRDSRGMGRMERIAHMAPFQEALDEARGNVKDTRKALAGLRAEAQRSIGKGFAESLRDSTKRLGAQKRLIEATEVTLRERLRPAVHKARAAYQSWGRVNQPPGWMKRIWDEQGNDLDRLRTNYLKLEGRLENVGVISEGLATGAIKRLRNATRSVGDESKDTGKRGSEAFEELHGAVREALGLIGSDVNKVLRELGIGRVNFGLSEATSPSRQRPKRNQRGGPITIPGVGAGDKVPVSVGGVPVALTEPGEDLFFLNKTASAERRELEEWNRNVPRFQQGGLAAGASKLAALMVNRFGGSISSGLRPGDDGHHGSGQAIDWVGGNWARASAYANQIGSSLLEGIYNPGMFGGTAVSWDRGARVSSSFWGSEWGNHLDHIHLAVGSGAKLGQPVATEIARRLLTGPDGAMKTLGQAAIDKAHKAGMRKIAQAMPAMVSHGNVNIGALGNATVKGRATWFTGGDMASGLHTDRHPGIALNPNPGGPDPGSWNNPTTQAWLAARQKFLVRVGGKSAVLPVLDMGPAGWTGNAIDVNLAGVRAMGYDTGSFPSGTIGTAQLVKRQRGGLVDWGGWHGKGGAFTVNRPTLFGAGERGTEDVVIRPHRGAQGSGGIKIVLVGKGAQQAFATLDDVYAIVDGEQRDVEAFKTLRERQKGRR